MSESSENRMTQRQRGDGSVGLSGFRRLAAWQKAFALALDVYRVTAQFLHSEQFGLSSQIQRAAVSVPSNIAEGFGRGQHTKDCARFLLMARGSLCEIETCLLLARELDYVSGPAFEQIDRARRETSLILAGLIKATAAQRER